MTFYFFNDVLLLHFPLEATQGVFERFAFLQSDFCQRNYTPKPVLWDSSVIARSRDKVKFYVQFPPLCGPLKSSFRTLIAMRTATGAEHTHWSLS